jgi:AraC-like DNA-binding protein
MKAVLEDLSIVKSNHSFVVYQYSVPFFEYKWHYHPEFELTFILSGIGSRVVGDSYEYFQSGDLVLLGADLPHSWISDKKGEKVASAIVIQFSKEFIERFYDFNEFVNIRKLLMNSSQGIYFPNPTYEIIENLKGMIEKNGVSKITALIEILDQLGELPSQKLLASPFYQPIINEENECRINMVCQFLLKNSSTSISLKSAAELIHLSESAFCKFFKRMTGKTFSDYVNEIRIGNACSLLTESDKTVSEIAFQTGFESITYFNRVFLRKKGRRPNEFRKVSKSERR